jgi:hypothetical protein
MTREDAARLLGVEPGASAAEVERAYRRKAHAVHPDAAGGPDDAFISLTRARDILLAVPPLPAPVAPSRPSRALFVTWIVVLLLAIFVSASMAPQPFTIAEPIARYTVLVAAFAGYALTGRRLFLVVALVALAATALIAVTFTTFGTLVGLLMMVAPVYGLLLMGQRTGRRTAVDNQRA